MVKRMTSDVTVSLQQKLTVSGVDGEWGGNHRSSKNKGLSRLKKGLEAGWEWVWTGRLMQWVSG